MGEGDGAVERSSSLMALKRRKARRIDTREYNLDDEEVTAPNRRASESATEDTRGDEVHVGEQVKTLAKNWQISPMGAKRSTSRWRNTRK